MSGFQLLVAKMEEIQAAENIVFADAAFMASVDAMPKVEQGPALGAAIRATMAATRAIATAQATDRP